ncbi:MAG: ATP-binding protein [Pirellulaceae bacterium]
MTKSLRLRLQLWQALILSTVVIVFASAFFRQLHHATMSEIDGELLSDARVLEGTLRTLEATSNDKYGQDALQELPLSLEPAHRLRPPRRPDERPNERPVGSPRPSVENMRRDRFGRGELERGHLGPPRDSLPYFAVFSAEGDMLHDGTSGVPVAWRAPLQPLVFRNAGEGRREVLLRGPGDSLIVVGRDVSRVMHRLNESLVQLIAIGAAVLSLGLIGGGWLAGKIIQPIRQISDTAERITAQSLSGRIDTSKMDSELQSLGGTLNSMLQRLEASFERQNQFTADASHELRTPISVLLSHCELSLSRQRSSDEYRSTIATCQSAAERMRSLVDGLLTLARADAGQMELQLAEVDLQTLAAQAMSMFSPLAHERQITIDLQGESTVCTADAERTAQVIANLLHNAILYNRPGGSVTLSTLHEAGCAVLRVGDTGAGIPPESLPHLFDRFYRVDHSRSRQAEDQRRSGSGLGLAICKSIIDAHHGSLAVTSQIGEGSQFELRLPLPSAPT